MKDILNSVIQTVEKANNLFLENVRNGYKTSYKHKNDPVTSVDLALDHFLREELLSNFPEFGWLSEETKDNPERLTKEYVWIVDPIDGTREFVKGIPEFTISIALIKNHSPVLGVIFNPSTKELYTAIKGEGARLNKKRIFADHTLGERPVIISSRSDFKKGKFDCFKPYADIIPIGSSAYKLARLAKGDADASITIHPMNEWDIAAGVLIVEEAEGIVTDLRGHTFSFNQSSKTLVDSFLATTKEADKPIRELLNKIKKREKEEN
ncbi:MAG: 3'(2'),5'-bisphosphate nucleotidase CysQ [Candidatus Heimdallarchaeaceae archaeon]